MACEPFLSDDRACITLASSKMLELRIEGVALILIVGFGRCAVELDSNTCN